MLRREPGCDREPVSNLGPFAARSATQPSTADFSAYLVWTLSGVAHPSTGVLVEILVPAGTTVSVGTALVHRPATEHSTGLTMVHGGGTDGPSFCKTLTRSSKVTLKSAL